MTAGPPLADRPDPEVEHRADVHGHRDRRHLEAAGADRQRLRRLDQRGRRRRQGDLGDQPGAAQDDERGQPRRRPDRRDGRATGRRASPAWTGRCGSSPTRPPRSARSSRSSASGPPTSTSSSPRSPRSPTRPTCSRSTRRSRPRRPASTASGFLVVAREIRRLADQTAVATLDIERMVKEMQYSVSAGVMEMDKFSDQVRQGVGEVGHDRRPARPDHRRRPGPDRAVRPGDRGDAGPVAGGRPDPRGRRPPQRGGAARPRSRSASSTRRPPTSARRSAASRKRSPGSRVESRPRPCVRPAGERSADRGREPTARRRSPCCS